MVVEFFRTLQTPHRRMLLAKHKLISLQICGQECVAVLFPTVNVCLLAIFRLTREDHHNLIDLISDAWGLFLVNVNHALRTFQLLSLTLFLHFIETFEMHGMTTRSQKHVCSSGPPFLTLHAYIVFHYFDLFFFHCFGRLSCFDLNLRRYNLF